MSCLVLRFCPVKVAVMPCHDAMMSLSHVIMPLSVVSTYRDTLIPSPFIVDAISTLVATLHFILPPPPPPPHFFPPPISSSPLILIPLLSPFSLLCSLAGISFACLFVCLFVCKRQQVSHLSSSGRHVDMHRSRQ